MSEKKIRWTEHQTQAIEARDVGLAVSAAAGSGKTAVLTERIVRLLSREDGVDVSELCVVTFTKAAAGELEAKLYNALTEAVAAQPDNRRLARQLFRLDQAHISTIDSFCLDLIRGYRRELDLRPGVRVCDETEEELLFQEAREEGLGAFLAEGGDGLDKKAFYALFCDAKKRDGLWAVLGSMKAKAENASEGVSFFRNRLEALRRETEAADRGEISFYGTRQGAMMKEGAQAGLNDAVTRLSYLTDCLARIPSLDRRRADLERRLEELREAQRILAGGETVRAGRVISEICARRLDSCGKGLSETDKAAAEIYKDAWNGVKGLLKALAAGPLSLPWEDRQADTLAFLPLCACLVDLFETVLALFAEKKRERNVLSFSDLSALTLRLVGKREGDDYVPTEAGMDIARRFKAVFVDEYQDTNSVQDAIFRCITDRRNLFLVGDPKQCVYHFRGAEPEVFIRYRKVLSDYPADPASDMARHFLSENFRCDRPIINFTNALFRVLMDKDAPDSLYRPEDELVPGKEKAAYRDLPVELQVILPPTKGQSAREEELLPVSQEKAEDEAAENREAAWIADRIRAILNGETTKADGSRYAPEDVAVITRKWSQVEKVKEALRRRGIPAAWAKGGEESAAPEEFFVSSLLRAADNPTRDVPLLAALYSPVFRFSPDDLFRLRKRHKDVSFFAALSAEAAEGGPGAPASAAALEALNRVRRAASAMSPTELIFFLYRTFPIEELYRKTSPAEGAVRLRFLRRAKAAEDAGFTTLKRFCQYLASVKEKEEGCAAGGGVNLMTIHKVKGLEFPVVFVSFQAASARGDNRVSGKVWSSPVFGATFPLPKWGGVTNREHLLTELAKQEEAKDAREEELRVLYVALTRAKEKLIITGAPRGFASLRTRTLFDIPDPLPAALARDLIQRALNPLELIFIGLHTDPALRAAMESGQGERDGFAARVSDPARENATRRETAEEAPPALAGTDAIPLPPWEKVKAALEFTYAHPERETLPKKLSVSEIVRQGREEEEQLLPRSLTDFERGVLKADAAFRGTALHQAMQFADLQAAARDPEGEIARLLREGFITSKMEREIDRAHFAAFFKSDLYRRVAASPRVVHEKRFNVMLPAKEILGRPGEILVQGVVDLWFEKEDGTLAVLDFKTDRLPPDGGAILIERHGEQLRLYRRAVEAIEEKKVTELILYSFSLDRAVPVPLEP